jgi:tetratricopeptide (TPR) repeat protein
MKLWIGAIALVALSGCSTAPIADAPTRHALFHDELFKPPSQPIDVREIFAVSPAMREYLNVGIARQLREKGPREGLVDALYRDGQLKLQYDSALTRSAAEAFEARQGNCLSLVIMTAALARELGLEVRYQRVFVEDIWSRAGGLDIASGHVNITIGRGSRDPRMPLTSSIQKAPITIDFIPLERERYYRAYSIEEPTVVAMFLNNRAVEAYAAGRIDDAYWLARAAVESDPGWLAAFNTMGALYYRHGNPREAERALLYVLEREPANTFALSNLALAYKAEGRMADAAAVSARLAKLEPFPPFYYFDQGQAAMRAGNYAAARDFFQKEVERDASYHEFHFWLGAALGALGDREGARKHLAIAIEKSTSRA